MVGKSGGRCDTDQMSSVTWVWGDWAGEWAGEIDDASKALERLLALERQKRIQFLTYGKKGLRYMGRRVKKGFDS